MEPKKVKYICENCKYEEEKQYPLNIVIPTELNCPKCNKITFKVKNLSYLERMKK